MPELPPRARKGESSIMGHTDNYTLLCDFYELTMGNGYFQTGMDQQICYFDVFFRDVPDGGGFAIAAGLEQIIDYIQDLRFSPDDVDFLRGKGVFSEAFLQYLLHFQFTGDIWAVPEGTPIFPGEPILTVRAPAIQAQFIETYVLLILNHQSLIATKSNFKTYCELYPHSATLLVDTYNVLKSGVPNAIRAFQEVLLPQGIHDFAIRLDSGDLTYLSKKARRMLDAAGLQSCKIVASNSLDEYIIRDLLLQGAQIDSFGVGERLITSKSEPVFGGVYKLSAIESKDGTILPRIKISENPAKITNPHFKKVYRLFENDTGKAIADLICVHDEVVDPAQPLELFDPEATWKRKTITDFTVRELLVPIFQSGELVYRQPSIEEMRTWCAGQIDTLWDEVKRFENPHNYYVDLSQKLWDIKHKLLAKRG